MTADADERIRERAYLLWKESGGGHGRDVDHWLSAEKEMGPAEAGAKKKKAAPKPKDGASTAKPKASKTETKPKGEKAGKATSGASKVRKTVSAGGKASA